MSLAVRTNALGVRIATELKAIRVLIGGTSTSTISGLTTTDKSSLVAAINEVKASATGAPPDATTTAKGVVELATDTETTTGTDTVRAITPSNLAASWTARIAVSTALGASDVVVPSQAAVKAYVDARNDASDALVYKGAIDASANPNYPAASAGHTYRISVAGKIGGASGPNVEVGDRITANVDGLAAGTQAAVGASWDIIQNNIDGAVVGPASSAAGNLPVFSGTTGKIIGDSGFAPSNAAIGAGSATVLPTSSAVKTYADTKQPLDADLTSLAALDGVADRFHYATGASTWALGVVTAFARSILDDVDAPAVRTTISVYSQTEIGDPETDFVANFNTALAT